MLPSVIAIFPSTDPKNSYFCINIALKFQPTPPKIKFLIFFTEIPKTDHKLSQTFYFYFISQALIEL